MKKKIISVNKSGKTETTRERRTGQSKNIIVTDHMPDWMQQYLSTKGLEREFDPSTLSPTQFSAMEYAERLYHSEKAGLIRVTFDPETDMEPRAELTDYGRTILQSSYF